MDTLNSLTLELDTLDALLLSLTAEDQNAQSIANAHCRVVELVNEGKMFGLTSADALELNSLGLNLDPTEFSYNQSMNGVEAAVEAATLSPGAKKGLIGLVIAAAVALLAWLSKKLWNWFSKVSNKSKTVKAAALKSMADIKDMDILFALPACMADEGKFSDHILKMNTIVKTIQDEAISESQYTGLHIADQAKVTKTLEDIQKSVLNAISDFPRTTSATDFPAIVADIVKQSPVTTFPTLAPKIVPVALTILYPLPKDTTDEKVAKEMVRVGESSVNGPIGKLTTFCSWGEAKAKRQLKEVIGKEVIKPSTSLLVMIIRESIIPVVKFASSTNILTSKVAKRVADAKLEIVSGKIKTSADADSVKVKAATEITKLIEDHNKKIMDEAKKNRK